MRSISSSGSSGNKPIPQRTCVACRRIKDQKELVRLVRTPENNIEIDINRRKKGRGAYLCPGWECWETAMKSTRLEHALRGRLTEDNREQLIEYSRDLPKGVN